jgi:hypothetical protein
VRIWGFGLNILVSEFPHLPVSAASAMRKANLKERRIMDNSKNTAIKEDFNV